MFRRAVALFGHAPGLWLIYRERLSPSLVWQNALAIALTLIAMTGAYLLFRSGVAVLGAWLVCHFLWGCYLAARLPSSK